VKTATLECPNCRNDHRVECDGEMGSFKTRLCAQLHCGTELCASCPQFVCEVCDGLFCSDHMVNGVCPECAMWLTFDASLSDEPGACGPRPVQSEGGKERRVA
jgi:hypothetical protein